MVVSALATLPKTPAITLRTSAGGELGITAGIDLGGGDGGWGDYSDLRDLEVSGLPNAVGIKLQVNVSVLYNCWTEQTKDGILNANEGPGASCLMAFGCGVMAFTGIGIKLQIADYWSGKIDLSSVCVHAR